VSRALAPRLAATARPSRNRNVETLRPLTTPRAQVAGSPLMAHIRDRRPCSSARATVESTCTRSRKLGISSRRDLRGALPARVTPLCRVRWIAAPACSFVERARLLRLEASALAVPLQEGAPATLGPRRGRTPAIESASGRRCNVHRPGAFRPEKRRSAFRLPQAIGYTQCHAPASRVDVRTARTARNKLLLCGPPSLRRQGWKTTSIRAVDDERVALAPVAFPGEPP